MTASERFRRYLSGEEVDRCTAIEWATRWNLTFSERGTCDVWEVMREHCEVL